MKICVINGSPKGKNSVTFQTVLYLRKHFPDSQWAVLHVGQRIRSYEKDLSGALETMKKADLLLFSYPVYTFLAPWQLHRFIELVKESGIDLSGRFATQISTSKHFYDVTAHRYIEQNSQDLGLKCIRGLSADMGDLTTQKGQKEALDFWNFVRYSVRENLYEMPCGAQQDRGGSDTKQPGKTGKKVIVVTNALPEDRALQARIQEFREQFPYETETVNIAQYPFAGGCLGCLKCAVDGTCVYRDNFSGFLRQRIQKADALVYAFTVRDHSMGASFKLYDDRQFCNGHRTVTMGMPVGYLINGDYGSEDNLRMLLEARAEVGHNYLAGAAWDTDGVGRLCQKLCYALENGYVPPQNFYGVGGMKIFRDLIYVMRGMMRADHAFYKKQGFYRDMPHRQAGTILGMTLVGEMLANPKLKAKMGTKMQEGMLAPYRKVLAEK